MSRGVQPGGMASKQAGGARRPPGSLRLVSKTAKGKTYQRWQWRTHRRTDTGWATTDLELGEDVAGLRTRVLVALGDLKAPLLLERFVRWKFRGWSDLPAWSGRPAEAKRLQRAAWWVEIPRDGAGSVRLRFRNLSGRHDYRLARQSIRKQEEMVSTIWKQLTDDPIRELARLQWQERECQQEAEKIELELVELKRSRRRGDLSQRDYEADERSAYIRLDGFQNVVARSAESYDELLEMVVAAMPRPSKERYRTRVLALVDRLLSDPKQRVRWHAAQWADGVLTWW